MRAVVALSAVALGQAAQFTAREKSLEATWEAELDGTDQPETKQVAKKNPIQRVIGMLKDMKSQLENEAAKEAEMYDQMVCWCETNEKEKTKAIADAEAKDKDLQAEIEARSARFGSVSTEIEAMKKQIDEDVSAVKQALAIRENEAGAFRAEEIDLIQNIQNLKNAIDVLKKHQGAALVQLDASTQSALHSVLREVSDKYEFMMAGEPAPKGTALLQTGEGLGKQLMNAFGQPDAALPVEFAQRILERSARQASSNGFLQSEQPIGHMTKSYSAASNQIFGIMETMLEDMESRLARIQKDEAKAKEDFEALTAAKNDGIDTGKEKLDEMQGEDAGNGKALSDAKEDLELTRKQRSADVKFLRNLKLTCQDLDRQWEERSKTRSAEIQAVSEALAIITEDDNREMLYKAQGFFQISASTEEGTEMAMRRANAAASLRKAAGSPAFDADDLLAAWHNRRNAPAVGTGPRSKLSTLAITVSLDGFEKVKAAMDKMVADLKAEQAEEVKLKEYCTENFNKNEKETFEATDMKEDLEAKMEELAALIEKFTQDIADAKKALAETETGILKASQTREEENAEFQVTVSDQRATQAILTKALNRLKDFYKKEAGGGAFVQHAQTPPVQFAKQKNNAGASPVMGMIAQIVEDSKATEAEAISTEKQAQADYETFVKDSNDLIASLNESITEKTKSISQSKAESENAKADHTATTGELELLAEHKAALHGECDFTLKNFDIRQKARLQEIEAIGQAKAILSGS